MKGQDAKGAYVIDSTQLVGKRIGKMMPENGADAEDNERPNAKQNRSAVRLFAGAQILACLVRDSSAHSSAWLRSLRRINLPSAASCSGSRSARTSTSDADTA
jgi:hypothetical protein